jgi:hypothetical protein
MIQSRERRNRRHVAAHRLTRSTSVVTNRCERSFARSLDKPHANSSRASWRRNDRIDLR